MRPYTSGCMFARCTSPTQRGICWNLSVTMQVWDRSWARRDISASLGVGRFIDSERLLFTACPQNPLPSPPRGRSYVLLKPIIDSINYHPISQEQKPPDALSLGSPQGASRRGKRTRRSIVTIGRRVELVETVRS